MRRIPLLLLPELFLWRLLGYRLNVQSVTRAAVQMGARRLRVGQRLTASAANRRRNLPLVSL
jgi:hypothetical protein